jgi:hypothetical protein
MARGRVLCGPLVLTSHEHHHSGRACTDKSGTRWNTFWIEYPV